MNIDAAKPFGNCPMSSSRVSSPPADVPITIMSCPLDRTVYLSRGKLHHDNQKTRESINRLFAPRALLPGRKPRHPSVLLYGSVIGPHRTTAAPPPRRSPQNRPMVVTPKPANRKALRT